MTYYENEDENGRLVRDKSNSIEYITTFHYLNKYLPIGCSVLDLCAGCGVYAFPLVKEGYEVTACDLMQNHVESMKVNTDAMLLNGIYQADVLDLSCFENESFDSVLCLGALYHLHSEKDREQCIRECMRVLKKDGIFMFAYINRNAIYINRFKNDASDIEYQKNVIQTGENKFFYGMNFGEAETLTNGFDLEQITNVGIDGLRYPLSNEINNATKEQFAAYMQYHLTTCEQPSIIGHSMHGLWIGRKL